MAPWMAGLAIGLQKMQENQAKKQASLESQAGIHAQRAQSMGYPAMGYGAAQDANRIRSIEGPNYLGGLMDAEEDGEISKRDMFKTFMR